MKNIAIVSGGDSGEYEISLKSGKIVEQNIDRTIFNTWFVHIKGKSWTHKTKVGAEYQIDKNDFSLTIDNNKINFDAVFLIIHGNPAENGKLQGYFDVLQIPYTSCDVLTSSLTFNKNYCNRVVKTYGINVATSIHLFEHDIIDLEKIIATTSLPCFVKPCNSGSSVGMSKVNKADKLLAAIELAFKFDEQILIEKFIKGREITCGVFKNKNETIVLPITEIITKKEYFDYEAKYTDGMSEEITPAKIPIEIETETKQTSKYLYERLNCKGVVRFDYIFNEDGLFFLEVNTIPGQSANSIVPQQVREYGLTIKEFYSSIINDIL